MIHKLTRGAIIAITAVMLLLPFNMVQAGIPVGTWRLHQAYNDATFSISAFSRIYVLSDGSIYYYDPSQDGLYLIDKSGGLSDTGIAQMAYCKSEKAIILVYKNGNIDLLYSDDTVCNVTDLKNNGAGSIDINEIKIYNSKAYISTSIGLVIFDVKRREISNTYRFDSGVNTMAIVSDTLFCGTGSGVLYGKTNTNLLDKSNWNTLVNKKFTTLFVFDSQLCGRLSDNTIQKIDVNSGGVSLISDKTSGVSFLNNGDIALLKDTAAVICSSLLQQKTYTFNIKVNNIDIIGNDIWVCHAQYGLFHYTETDGTVVCKESGIKPSSPRRNWFNYVTWPQQNRMLAVGGYQNYNGIDYPGTLMMYDNENWYSFEDELQNKTGHNYINLTEIVQDPLDDSHVFAGSARQGLYEFYNLEFVKLHTWDNSALANILDENKYDYVSVSTLAYDSKGNLWIANNEVDTVIRILDNTGTWHSLYYPEIKSIPTFRQMKFRSDRFLWFNSSRGSNPGPGIICIDNNNTPFDNRDDRIRFSGPVFTNQDGTTKDIYDIFFMEFDLNGELWIGTNTGIFVLKEPDNYLSNDSPVFERIKIPRKDGSGLADYLFDGAMTTAIYIDQANRKWIGTMNNGVFLLTEDGRETIEHFTTSNSPLPSDYILSISENGLNGSVFIGTDAGLIEYGGTARDPQEKLSESKIMVYPNPVRPDFDGYVTITGLTQESIVKITGNSGRLIHQAKSNGGSYSWDLRDMNGRTVPSGVYHAIITDKDNSTSQSKSITVIR